MSHPGEFHAVTTAEFDPAVLAISRERPVLVDFWTASCAPCKAMAPTLARLAAEYAGRADVVKVAADEEPAIAIRYGVRSLPAILVFRGGQVVDSLLNAQAEPALRALIERHL